MRSRVPTRRHHGSLRAKALTALQLSARLNGGLIDWWEFPSTTEDPIGTIVSGKWSALANGVVGRSPAVNGNAATRLIAQSTGGPGNEPYGRVSGGAGFLLAPSAIPDSSYSIYLVARTGVNPSAGFFTAYMEQASGAIVFGGNTNGWNRSASFVTDGQANVYPTRPIVNPLLWDLHAIRVSSPSGALNQINRQPMAQTFGSTQPLRALVQTYLGMNGSALGDIKAMFIVSGSSAETDQIVADYVNARWPELLYGNDTAIFVGQSNGANQPLTTSFPPVDLYRIENTCISGAGLSATWMPGSANYLAALAIMQRVPANKKLVVILNGGETDAMSQGTADNFVANWTTIKNAWIAALGRTPYFIDTLFRTELYSNVLFPYAAQINTARQTPGFANATIPVQGLPGTLTQPENLHYDEVLGPAVSAATSAAVDAAP